MHNLFIYKNNNIISIQNDQNWQFCRQHFLIYVPHAVLDLTKSVSSQESVNNKVLRFTIKKPFIFHLLKPYFRILNGPLVIITQIFVL